MSASTPTPVTRSFTSTVAPNGTLGTPLDLGIMDANRRIVGFQIKGTVVSSSMTFNVSHQADGVNFFTLKTDTGSSVTVNIASNSSVGIKQDVAAQLGSWRYVQPVMGSTETGGATILVDVE